MCSAQQSAPDSKGNLRKMEQTQRGNTKRCLPRKPPCIPAMRELRIYKIRGNTLVFNNPFSNSLQWMSLTIFWIPLVFWHVYPMKLNSTVVLRIVQKKNLSWMSYLILSSDTSIFEVQMKIFPLLVNKLGFAPKFHTEHYFISSPSWVFSSFRVSLLLLFHISDHFCCFPLYFP